MTKQLYKLGRYLKHNAPTILTWTSIIGTGITSVSFIRSYKRSLKRLKKATDEKGEELTKFERALNAAPSYIPSAALYLVTAGCMISADIINKKQKAALMSAYILVSDAYEQYKNKIKESYATVNSQTRSDLINEQYQNEKPESGESCLFYEEHYGQFFNRTKEDVLTAEYRLNSLLISRGYVTLNDFYGLLGLYKIESGDVLGWSAEEGTDVRGFSWIDFEHELVEVEGGMECYVIDMAFKPTARDLQLV